MVIIKPYDAGQLGAIEKALRDSDLGVNPNNEGTQIRINLPQMTEERRREMIKVARGKGEDAKVAVRNVRRKAKEELDRIVKDGEAGEDDGRRAEKELDDLTHKYVGQPRRAHQAQGSRAARGLMSYLDPSRDRDVRRGRAAGGDSGFEYGDGVSAHPMYGPTSASPTYATGSGPSGPVHGGAPSPDRPDPALVGLGRGDVEPLELDLVRARADRAAPGRPPGRGRRGQAAPGRVATCRPRSASVCCSPASCSARCSSGGRRSSACSRSRRRSASGRLVHAVGDGQDSPPPPGQGSPARAGRPRPTVADPAARRLPGDAGPGLVRRRGER